jgi:hypothetical protein
VTRNGERRVSDDVDLDGVEMFVSSTAADGVVGAGTRLRLLQRGSRLLGRYDGGAIRRGCLVGRVSGGSVVFRYAQVEASGQVHAGRSVCEISRTPAGTLRLVERFVWTTREGRGTNTFDECAR